MAQELAKYYSITNGSFPIVDVLPFLWKAQIMVHIEEAENKRLIAEGSESSTFCHGLKLEASDGKQCITDCANTEGVLRIIQSIPSPKAEPFKLWLSKIGKERIDEIANPELGIRKSQEFV